AVRAVQAGADLLLMPPDLPGADAAIVKAVHTGRISVASLDAAVQRILTLKERRGLFAAGLAAPGVAVSTPEHRRTALDVATRSVTILKNPKKADNALPLKGDVFVTGPGQAAVSAALTKAGVKVSGSPSARTHVVITTEETARSLARLTRRKKVVALVLGDPYLLRLTAPAQVSATVYSTAPIALRGLARVLSGAAAPTGRLPLAVPDGPALGAGTSSF
ncbi:glycoside hydrolase family 3 protein, partial [Actinocorallia lasiicapitis]